MQLARDLSVSAAVAGLVTVLVGITSSLPVAFEASRAVGATPDQTSSWIWALGIGTGITSIGLSLAYRKPILTAWATSGAALIAGTEGIAYADALGAFVCCGVLLALAGYTGLFAKLMDRLPLGLASALLAGVLARFAVDGFSSLEASPAPLVAMFVALLAGRRLWPRYAVLGVLVAGVAVAAAQGDTQFSGVDWELAKPEWTTPAFDPAAIVGLGVPLFIVTMASQNLPGVAAQRAAGFEPPVSTVVGTTGAATVALAPFGGFALNFAAITAAICLSPEAHPDPNRRYAAPIVAGALYLVIGLLGGAVTGLFTAIPRAVVIAVAGLALLGTIANGLATALKEPAERDAAIVTFLVAMSGAELAGIGPAFWAVVAGTLTLAAARFRRG
ncbi:MAG: benzoate/H(+) symporter BenE family transporter [Dehalococcoidia bacterium]